MPCGTSPVSIAQKPRGHCSDFMEQGSGPTQLTLPALCLGLWQEHQA